METIQTKVDHGSGNHILILEFFVTSPLPNWSAMFDKLLRIVLWCCVMCYIISISCYSELLTEFNEAQDTDPWHQIGNLCCWRLNQQFLSSCAAGYFVLKILLEFFQLFQSWTNLLLVGWCIQPTFLRVFGARIFHPLSSAVFLL